MLEVQEQGTGSAKGLVLCQSMAEKQRGEAGAHERSLSLTEETRANQES